MRIIPDLKAPELTHLQTYRELYENLQAEWPEVRETAPETPPLAKVFRMAQQDDFIQQEKNAEAEKTLMSIARNASGNWICT